MPTRTGRRRRVHRDRDRRADAAGRRRRRDGRRDRAGRGIGRRPRSSRRCIRGSTSAAARPTSPSGQPVLRAGDVLNPSRIGALAAVGALDVEVYAQARGSRSCRPATRSSNPASRSARDRSTTSTASRSSSIIAAHGGVPVILPTAQDTIEALSAAIDSALAEDVLVFSGGSSVGERDLILDVLLKRGEVLFHGVAVKPGKPTVFGHVDGKPVLGMPGYPTSCLSNGYMLLVPMLRRMARLPEHRPQIVRVPLGAAHRLDDGPAPVLHRADRRRRRGAGVQGVGRHHQHVARRRLHRDPRAGRHRRSRRARGREVVLMHTVTADARARIHGRRTRRDAPARSWTSSRAAGCC